MGLKHYVHQHTVVRRWSSSLIAILHLSPALLKHQLTALEDRLSNQVSVCDHSNPDVTVFEHDLAVAHARPCQCDDNDQNLR